MENGVEILDFHLQSIQLKEYLKSCHAKGRQRWFYCVHRLMNWWPYVLRMFYATEQLICSEGYIKIVCYLEMINWNL
jgi:hypothetical protein